jgi:general secretion pathway protein D
VDHVNIGGIDQPVIGRRLIDLGMIQLRDGESNVLGGIIENSDVRSLSGIPGLSSIPGLKWLFSTTHTEHTSDEVLIVMTPHIVRHLDVTAFNRKVIDTGTLNTIELHELPPATAVTPPAQGTQPAVPRGPVGTVYTPSNNPQPGAVMPATVGAPGIVQQGPGVPAPGTVAPPSTTNLRPGATPPAASGAASTPAGSVLLRFDPPTVDGVVGNPFSVNLALDNADGAYALSLQLNYDPRMIEVQTVSNAGFLSNDGQPVAVVHRDDPSTGTDQITVSRPPNTPGISGSGAVLAVSLRAKAAGATVLSVSRVMARNAAGQQIPVRVSQANVQIR